MCFDRVQVCTIIALLFIRSRYYTMYYSKILSLSKGYYGVRTYCRGLLVSCYFCRYSIMFDMWLLDPLKNYCPEIHISIYARASAKQPYCYGILLAYCVSINVRTWMYTQTTICRGPVMTVCYDVCCILMCMYVCLTKWWADIGLEFSWWCKLKYR